MIRRPVRIETPSGPVSGILLEPAGATHLFVFAHGAGAGMEHRLMEGAALSLAEAGLASLRYQFPYMEAGKRRPDRAATLQGTVRAAVEEAARLRPDLPRIAGGRSMGGRMTSQADAEEHLDVDGLLFLAFPLHRPGALGRERAEHLFEVEKPMLFVNGTRDALADLDLLREVTDELGERATLHVVEGADHSFKVLKRSGRTEKEVEEEIRAAVAGWVEDL